MLQKMCSVAGFTYQTCGNVPLILYGVLAVVVAVFLLCIPDLLAQNRWKEVAERLGCGKTKMIKGKQIWVAKKLKIKREKPFFGKIKSAIIYDDNMLSKEKWNSQDTIEALEGVLKCKVAVLNRPKIGARYVEVALDTLQ
jgi:hypothetical protein